MSPKWLFAVVGVLALLAGTALWLGNERPDRIGSAEVAPGALFAASFRGIDGQSQSLGRFEGRLVVLNFWATWCAPCREEMPGFARLQARWAGRNVQFVGVANDDAGRVARFAQDLHIEYPLLTGGADVDELARRLGNREGVLPFTVVIDPQGHILDQHVGAYLEADLDAQLGRFVSLATSK